jgi:hypothetical protein
MAKTKISEFDVDPANNTDINNINIAEGCAPSGINNAIRQLMSDLKEFQTGAGGDPFNGAVNGTVGATTPASGAFTTLSASSTATLNTLSSSGATITGGSINGTTVGASTASTGAFTSLSASGVFSANGGATLGDASGDALTINSSAVSIPNGLNFGSNQFVITSAGNIGVGTSSPFSASGYGALTINGSTGGISSYYTGGSETGRIQSFSDGTNIGVLQLESMGSLSQMRFRTNGSERMRINSSGNVGIGTSSPGSRLTIAGSDNPFRIELTNGNFYQREFGGTSANNTLELNIRPNAGKSGYLTFTEDAISDRWAIGIQNGVDALRFISGIPTGGTERMRIDSAGNLLVGVTSGFTHRLWKNNAGGVVTDIANTSSTAGSRCLELSMGTTADATGTFIRCADNGAFRFLVLGNGNALNANNSYGALSDIKLKENIVDATPKLEKLNQVRIVNYNLIGEEQKQIGVIAQELEQVFPSMVDEMPDRDKEGNYLGTTTKSVKYSVFVPMLIKAIQEQQAIITDLKSRIEALENK